MAEKISIPNSTDREEIYRAIIPQLKSLLEGETDLVANMANTAAVLREAFGFFWVGFYIVRGEELVLGPFQGPVACTRIARGRGVCGKAWESRQTIVVPDVEQFPGHIACSSESRSEIVIPIIGSDGRVIAVLDVDSDSVNDFTAQIDGKYLEEIVKVGSKIRDF